MFLAAAARHDYRYITRIDFFNIRQVCFPIVLC